MVIAMIGPSSSRPLRRAACSGERPAWRWRSTFSTTTMASSTTRPTASTTARRVSRFTVNPSSTMMKAVPIREIGIAITGMITERTEPRKRKITSTTIPRVSVIVLSTSWIASRMKSVES